MLMYDSYLSIDSFLFPQITIFDIKSQVVATFEVIKICFTKIVFALKAT